MKQLAIDRAATASLVPRPGTNSIARVLVLDQDDSETLVLDIDALEQNPSVLNAIDNGYASTLRFWNWFAAGVFWAGVATSFFWEWWVFIPAIVIATFLWRMNRKSLVKFAAGALAANRYKSELVFKQHGLVWVAETAKIKEDTT